MHHKNGIRATKETSTLLKRMESQQVSSRYLSQIASRRRVDSQNLPSATVGHDGKTLHLVDARRCADWGRVYVPCHGKTTCGYVATNSSLPSDEKDGEPTAASEQTMRIPDAPLGCENSELLKGLPGIGNLGDFNLTKEDLLIR
jgi:hypothetical protein